MNYEKTYALLIDSRKNRELDLDEYYEKHHIWPKSLGGPNEDWNIIHLTAREHYLAHELLYKMCEDDDKLKMSRAFFLMCSSNSKHKRNFTARQFERARKAMSETMKTRTSGENNPNFGRKHSEKAKRKLSKANKGEIIIYLENHVQKKQEEK